MQLGQLERAGDVLQDGVVEAQKQQQELQKQEQERSEMLGSSPLDVDVQDFGCAAELKALRELQAQLQLGELAKGKGEYSRAKRTLLLVDKKTDVAMKKP